MPTEQPTLIETYVDTSGKLWERRWMPYNDGLLQLCWVPAIAEKTA